MPGRCTDCGKYHYDGPPCDNCGTMMFNPAEKIMRCADCGEIHRDDSPPCNNCGAMGFTRVDNPDTLTQSNRNTSDDSSTLSPSTDRRQYLYGGGIALALASGAYLFMRSDDYPTTTAPGEADEASGIRFATVETEIRGIINDNRELDGVATLSQAENVDAFATYYNKKYVKAGGEFSPINAGSFAGKFNLNDYYAAGTSYDESAGNVIDRFDSASELGQELVHSWLSDPKYRKPLTSPQYSKIGLDVHVNPLGNVFALVVVD